MIVMMGDCGVGKSTLLKRFKSPDLEWTGDSCATIGVDYVKKHLVVADRHINLTTWDTAG